MDYVTIGENGNFYGRWETEAEAIAALDGMHGWIYKYYRDGN